MPATLPQARDQMCALFKAALDAAVTGGAPAVVVLWDDVNGQPPAGTAHWCRFRTKHALGGEASLTGALGTKRYFRAGTIVVQLFTTNGQGLNVNDQMVPIIMGAFEGKTTSGGVIFRHVRQQEVGKDGPWFQTNVFAEFEYDEVK